MRKSAVPPQSRLVRRAVQPLALEPRFMFDGAAASDATQVLAAAASADAAPESVDSALQLAQTRVAEFFRAATDPAIFRLFGGSASEADASWAQRLADLRQALDAGGLPVDLRVMDQASDFAAVAAYAEAGPEGRPTIFVSRFWAGLLDTQFLARVMVEELGHAIDDQLNPGADTAGDEGERFAGAVLGQEAASDVQAQADQGWVMVDDVRYEVEFASYKFVNAYEMLRDVDGDGVVDNVEDWAEKEQESHAIILGNGTYANGLGAVSISDGSNGINFSGNDVSAVAANIGGTTFYGWISRPLKIQGQVVGFYMWTDADFTSLALAQQDGNQDRDATVEDNRGFILVVNQAYFSGLTTRAVSVTAGAEIGTYTVTDVGSSSDRVDSALNGLVSSNNAPAATHDVADGTNGTTAAREAGYNVTTVNATGAATGVLANDTDANGDTLAVTQVGTSSVTLAGVTSGTTSANGTSVTGRYGTLTLGANGSYSYVVNNSNATVDALQVGSSLTDTFTYTVSDGRGGSTSATLGIRINGSNDAPTASADYNTAKETITVSTITYNGYNATGDVTVNDADVDDGEANKSISGLSISGAATIGTVSVTQGTYQLVFSSSQGNSLNAVTANSTATADELYISLTGPSPTTYYGVYAYNGVSYTLVSAQTKTASATLAGGFDIALSATPTHYWNGSSYVAIANLATFFSTYTTVHFENSGNQTENESQGKDAVVSNSASSGHTTLTGLSNLSGTIAVGMTVSGTGVPTGTKISEITYTSGALTSIKLDKELTSTTGGSFTFSRTGTVSQAIAGAHGSLTLSSDGTYTYTATADNSLLSAGQSAVEAFNYTMQDSQGVTSSSTLYITVYGAGTNDPVPATDTAMATETGVTAGSPATGNVVTNDKSTYSATAGTGVTVTEVGLQGSGTTTTNLTNAIAGIYGSLSIDSNGDFTYTVTDGNTVVNALAPGQSLTEVFNYKATNSSSLSTWSKLTITIQGTNDAPAAVADTAAVVEDSGVNATGAVLANDTDVDNNESRTVSRAGTTSANTAVTSGTTSSNGLQVSGTYGVLTIGADGTYSYALTNSNPLVQALTPTSPALQDVFRYEVTDAYGGTAVTTLTLSITGANEPPVNSYPATVTVGVATSTTQTTLAFTGGNAISVGDADTNLSWAALAVDHGTLDFTGSTPVGLTITGSGTQALFISGDQADINSALALLRYTPTVNYTGLDYLTITSQDANYANDSDSVEITVGTPLTLAVSGPTQSVSEGSTALFQVTGNQVFAPGTQISLALDHVSTQAGDFSLTKVYYLSGGVEQQLTVTNGQITIPASTAFSTFYVRVTTTADSPAAFEGAESFRLTAAFVDATLAASDPASDNNATATLIDDGTGTVYNATGVDTQGTADDDRTLSVTAYGPVNEGSQYAMFTVTGIAGYKLDLSLQGTASDSDTEAAFAGFTTLEYSTNGSTWSTYNASSATTKPTVPGAGKVYVRVTITSEADSPFEGSEGFALKAAYTINTAGSATGETTIVDDGTGTLYGPDVDPTQGPNTSTSSLDDDRTVSVAAHGPVNEASPYAMFTVTALQGYKLDLSLQGTASTTDTEATYAGFTTIEYSTDGSSWSTYNASSTATKPTVPGAGKVYVRVTITSEADTAYEGAEGFALKAAYTTHTARNATGETTIVDDGTGTKYGPDVDPTSGPNTSIASLDDDRPITVTGGDYNENSPRAVFTVNTHAGRVLTLDVQDAASVGKTPTGGNEGKPNDALDTAAVYVSLDGGATWQLYTGPITAGHQPVLVAVDITNERDAVYEGEQQLKLVVTSGQASASGFASIFDDGTGTVTRPIGPTTTNETGGNDPAQPKDDDRPRVEPPAAPPPPAPPVPAPAAPPPPPEAPPVPPPAPVPSFSSALTPLAPRLDRAAEPPAPIGDALTSNSGFPVVANESAPAGLTVNRGVSDQFVQTTGTATKLSLPFDAFMHSNKDAVIKLEARQSDNSSLPAWVSFDPVSGVFEVAPPPGFKGKLDVKVTARDDDGREAVALFQLFIGEQDATRPQSREGLSEKLKLAGKRGLMLVREADAPSAAPAKAPVREVAMKRVRVG